MLFCKAIVCLQFESIQLKVHESLDMRNLLRAKPVFGSFFNKLLMLGCGTSSFITNSNYLLLELR